VSYIHRVTDGHEITSEERLLGSFTRKPTHPKVTVPRQLVPRHSARTVCFCPERRRRAGRPHARGRAIAGVGARGRGARREGGAGKPPLSAVTAALRVRLGIASDLSSRPSGKYQIGLTPRSSQTIDLFRYMPPACAPMTSVASRMKKTVLSGESARMTREQ